MPMPTEQYRKAIYAYYIIALHYRDAEKEMSFLTKQNKHKNTTPVWPAAMLKCQECISKVLCSC